MQIGNFSAFSNSLILHTQARTNMQKLKHDSLQYINKWYILTKAISPKLQNYKM